MPSNTRSRLIFETNNFCKFIFFSRSSFTFSLMKSGSNYFCLYVIFYSKKVEIIRTIQCFNIEQCYFWQRVVKIEMAERDSRHLCRYFDIKYRLSKFELASLMDVTWRDIGHAILSQISFWINYINWMKYVCQC